MGLYQSKGSSILNPQSRWLDGVEIGFVGRFERLAEDVRHLQWYLSVPPRTLPHLNQSNLSDYRDYYDEPTRRLVRSLYAEDFDRFEYPTTL